MKTHWKNIVLTAMAYELIEAIKAGATPLEAACAISTNTECRLAVLSERNKK